VVSESSVAAGGEITSAVACPPAPPLPLDVVLDVVLDEAVDVELDAAVEVAPPPPLPLLEAVPGVPPEMPKIRLQPAAARGTTKTNPPSHRPRRMARG